MTVPLCVIGAGPAGLRAAEVAAEAGLPVRIYDAMPSGGRKFLVAGRGGLNISNSEPIERFVERYSGGSQEQWRSLLEDFSPTDLRNWVESHGVKTFVGSGRRIYPEGMKSAPLLRRWITRLRAMGVSFFPRHRWTGLSAGSGWGLQFDTPAGEVSIGSQAVIFALGGGSWPGTGSDGSWVDRFVSNGICVDPLMPANCGWNVAWTTEFLHEAEGRPLKNISASAGLQTASGELLITRDGLEGGVIYTLTPALRAMSPPVLMLDLKPAFSHEVLVSKMSGVKRLHLHEAAERWRLDSVAAALLKHHPLRETWTTVELLVAAVKALPIALTGPRPLKESISSAGGVSFSAVTTDLMLKDHPGIFIAGEMLGWEAPTGGYLMQGCFCTGTRAARGAIDWLKA